MHRATPDPPKWTRAFYFYGPAHHLDGDNAAGGLLAPATSSLKLFIEFMSLGQPAHHWRHSRLSSDLQWLCSRVTAGSLLPASPTIPLIYPRCESSQESVSGLQICVSTQWKTSECPKSWQNLLSKCQYSQNLMGQRDGAFLSSFSFSLLSEATRLRIISTKLKRLSKEN